jgi:hypothetical protein
MSLDAATEKRLKLVVPEIAILWRRVADTMWAIHKVQLKVACGYRSFAEQWKVYGQGRVKDRAGNWIICDIRQVVSYALPGQSYHQYGLGIDSCFAGADPYLERINKKDAALLWAEYGRICKAQGLEWGGDWKHPDRPHCQLTFDLSLNDLQIIYENSGINGVFSRCSAIAKCGSEVLT